MVTDSLRYWVKQMQVDGFRFDLGTILAREPNGFDNQSGFLKACSQDPVLGRVKLIAEPWDCGPGGYQVGGFPPGWAEWNDRFRDTVRDFWKGEAPAGRLGAESLRFGRYIQSSGPQAMGVDQFHHGSRWIHAERSRHLQRETQRGQRRRTTRTAAPTTVHGIAAWKGRRTIRRSTPARAADAQYAGHASAFAGHADARWRATNSGARNRATTTRTARTTKSVG